MDTDRQQKLEEIFEVALGKGSLVERAAYLDGACGEDTRLRERVEALLAAHDRAGSFLEAPAVGSRTAPTLEGPGTRIGPYKLLQLIGEGGFGAVYMAEQDKPVRRRVALKIIKLGMDTKQVIARFEAERQALALMDHPNISRVLDAGSTDTGRPYFVMELVRGVEIRQYCDQANLAPRERLELFLAVCRAVQHAHQKGIIHRDLKPSNVLVTLHDGQPVPKVIDFGIARATNQRLTERTLFTEYGQFIGTPEYMSPEQAEMSGLDIDTRTDIYSLGVMLYELLTGTTPLDRETLREAGFMQIQRIIREEEPPIPSTRVSTMGEQLGDIARHRQTEPRALSRLIRGDLDWIVMKALEKDRTRRYESASEMAADLRRHLDQQPVSAGPPTVGYRFRKFVARHRVGVLAGLLVAAALLSGFTLATVGMVQARREAARSQRIADFLQDLLASTDPEQAMGSERDVEQVVATAREVFGDDHATVAATLTSRALKLQSTGNLGAAEPLYREAIRIWRENYGEDHLSVAVTLGCLGGLNFYKGDERAAEEALRESLSIMKRAGADGSLAMCASRHLLAMVLLNRGRYDEASQLLGEALRIRREKAPQQLVQIAITLNSLANAAVLEGDFEKAKPLVIESAEAYRRALPTRKTFLAKVDMQTGVFLLRSGDGEAGEPFLRRAVSVFRERPDAPLADRQASFSALYRWLEEKGDDSPFALDLYKDYVPASRELIGEDDPRYLNLLVDVGERLVGIGRVEEAIPLLEDAEASLVLHEDEADNLDRARKTLDRARSPATARDSQEPKETE